MHLRNLLAVSSIVSTRAFYLISRPTSLQFGLRFLTMQNGDEVGRMDVSEFGSIVKSDLRDNYQIIDVREANELQMVALKDSNIKNLSLQTAGDWTSKVEQGLLLDSTKPTICLCHHGMRSMRVAMFLKQQAGFDEVYNLEGGIHKYAIEVDPSIGTY
jgi:rhodanese-related sulfurtransferase